jgi:hypothetical protein
MNIFKATLFISIILFPAIAKAQVAIVNALPEIQEEEELGWSTAIAASANYRDDNSKEKKLTLSLSGSSTYRSYGWLMHGIAKGAYEWIDGVDEEANTVEHLRFRFTPNKIFSPDERARNSKGASGKACRSGNNWKNMFHLEAFAQHEYDKFRALDARTVAGTGGVFIIETDHIDIGVGTSYMFEYINFYASNQEEFNHRWSNYLQLEIDPIDTISIVNTTFIQFRIDDMSDILIMTSLGLKVKATKWFGIQLSFGIDFDSQPPANVKDVGIGTGADIIVEF